MRCYSKGNVDDLEGFEFRAGAGTVFKEGDWKCLGGKARFDACSTPVDPIFWGEADRDSVPNWMRLTSYSRPKRRAK